MTEIEQLQEENRELKAKLEVADELNANAFQQIVELGAQVRYYENMLKTERYKAPWNNK